MADSLSGLHLTMGAMPAAHFGADSLTKLGPVAAATGGAAAVIVTDAGMLETPVIAAVQAELDAAGITFIVLGGVHANPTTDDLAAGADVVAGLALASRV